MRVIWTADGLDPFELGAYLFVDHPLFAAFGLATLAWAYFMLFDRVPLLGISRGRAGAGAVDTELPNKREEALERIRAADPDFRPDAFLSRAVAAYAAVDEGWNARDMSRARAFVSDGVFERFSRRLAEHRDRGVRRRVSELALKKIETAGYVAGPHFDAVYVSFAGSVVSELVALEGEAVVAGGREDFIEVWTFLRRPGAKTLGRSGPIEGCCPACGAALEIVDAAKCAACGAWVNSGEHDWVLTEVTDFAAWSFPDPDKEVDGWPALREADPDLSLEALEDRAAVVYWRWLDARRRGDPAPLRGVSSDAFLEAFVLDGRFDREVAVAGVETTACTLGPSWDRVHVQVSWTSERMRRDGGGEETVGRGSRTFFFILERRHGASSDVQAGLRTSRCPSCGAAPGEADAAACAYCGHAFNDGAKTWILSEVVPFGVWTRPGG